MLQNRLTQETLYEELQATGTELKQVENELAEKEMRWLELSDLT